MMPAFILPAARKISKNYFFYHEPGKKSLKEIENIFGWKISANQYQCAKIRKIVQFREAVLWNNCRYCIGNYYTCIVYVLYFKSIQILQVLFLKNDKL